MKGRMVTPKKLLHVELADRAARSRVVMDIRYVVAVTAGGTRSVAIELEWDPVDQSPQSEYFCPETRVRRELLPPASVRRVHPYIP